MHRTTLQLMRNHVRDIHQALTGRDLPETEPQQPPATAELSPDGVMRLFTDLEVVARNLPEVAERIPPFSFEPPVDLLEGASELLAEIAVPGVEREDVLVDLKGDVLTVAGARDPGTEQNGHRLVHAEIARGPFRRVLRLPHPVSGDPRVDVRQGLIRIQMTKAPPAGAQH
jgi:HSP20 family molecular chaperone IbpA